MENGSAVLVGSCDASSVQLPEVLAGPIIRHTSAEKLVVWLVTSTEQPIKLQCYQDSTCLAEANFPYKHAGHVQIGTRAHLHLLELNPNEPLPKDDWLSYDIGIGEPGNEQWLAETTTNLFYEANTRPDFIIKSHVDHVLHGSCRKPHHDGQDGLLSVDKVLATARVSGTSLSEQPALLMMNGDQIYADDVAGPMLSAIQQVMALLGLYDEQLEALDKPLSGNDLVEHPCNMYGRNELLPDTKANDTLRDALFRGARKPIFTSVHSDNHLISLGEILGMYLLVWSPVLWEKVSLEEHVPLEEHVERHAAELKSIKQFIKGLPRVRRALAHVPVYMIFDDHDVTDDWNLNRSWEERAYQQPFSKRIIGNALIGYLLCQGWGNAPQNFEPDLIEQVRDALSNDLPACQDALIERLFALRKWHYIVETTPKLVVLDTRTQRWWCKYGKNTPSGLLDEAALDELQTALLDEKSVILVSPAPIFGVKLIEAIQRVFTWFGQPLMVDAENWMGHRQAAHKILKIFKNPRTPHHFVILSGDVHYSFTYDVRLRRNKEGPLIWQITSSGIMSTFPAKLLRAFDRLNRFMFAGYSPLNWFTRRRAMYIRPRRPIYEEGRYRHQRLLNGNGIGRVRLDETGQPTVIESIQVDKEKPVGFKEGYHLDWL